MRRSRWQLAFTCILVAFSSHFAVVACLSFVFLLATSMGVAAFRALVLCVGWVVPCTIAGVHIGLIMDARVKGGTDESQMLETVVSICGGTIAGLLVGLIIDGSKDSGGNEGSLTTRQD